MRTRSTVDQTQRLSEWLAGQLAIGNAVCQIEYLEELTNIINKKVLPERITPLSTAAVKAQLLKALNRYNQTTKLVDYTPDVKATLLTNIYKEMQVHTNKLDQIIKIWESQ